MSEDERRRRPLHLTELELAFARQAIKEHEERRALIRLAESMALKAKTKRKPRLAPGPDPSAATIRGAELREQHINEPWAVVKPEICALIEGYASFSPPKRRQEWRREQGKIRKYMSRHKKNRDR